MTPALERPRTRGVALLLAAALALAAGAWVASDLREVLAAGQRLPLWDMAGHGWGGAELLEALAAGRPLAFLARLNAQDKWPFGFSLGLLPFLAAGGASFAAATLPSLLLFALAPALLVWLASLLDESAAAPWSGLAAAALWLASPLLRVHGILIMREVAGAVLTLVALGLWLAASRRPTLGAWRAAGGALLALFLVKYNYAVLLAAGLALDLLLRLPAARRRELAARSWALLWPGRHGTGGAWVRALVVWGILAAALLGANIGPALYVLLLAATAIVLWRWLRGSPSPAARLAALSPRRRGLAETLVVPLWLWCLSPYPVHLKTILGFLRNRPGDAGAFSDAGPLFYLHAFGSEFTGHRALGIVVLGLAGLGLALALAARRRLPAAISTLAVTAGVGFVLASLHPYRDPRFLATVAPLVFLLAAVAPAAALSLPAPGRPRRLATHVAGLALALGCAWPFADPAALARRLAADYELCSAEPRFAVPLDLAAAAVRPGERVALLGTFNELSPHLVRWRLVQLGRSARVIDPPPRFAADLPAAEIRARLERWRREERPQRVVAFHVQPGSPVFASSDYQRYNAWQRAAIAALLADPDWSVLDRRRVTALKLEVLELVPVGR